MGFDRRLFNMVGIQDPGNLFPTTFPSSYGYYSNLTTVTGGTCKEAVPSH